MWLEFEGKHTGYVFDETCLPEGYITAWRVLRFLRTTKKKIRGCIQDETVEAIEYVRSERTRDLASDVNLLGTRSQVRHKKVPFTVETSVLTPKQLRALCYLRLDSNVAPQSRLKRTTPPSYALGWYSNYTRCPAFNNCVSWPRRVLARVGIKLPTFTPRETVPKMWSALDGIAAGRGR